MSATKRRWRREQPTQSNQAQRITLSEKVRLYEGLQRTARSLKRKDRYGKKLALWRTELLALTLVGS